MAKAIELTTALETTPQKIIPPTSEHFNYILLTKENVVESLKEIFQGENQDSYSYNLAAVNKRLFAQDGAKIEDIVDLRALESKEDKLPKCHIVKVKSGGNSDGDVAGLVNIYLSNLEGPKATQKMYQFQILTKNSVSPKDQQEIIQAASVDYFRENSSLVDGDGNSLFSDAYYLITTISESKDKGHGMKKFLEAVGWSKVILSEDAMFARAIKGNQKVNFKSEGDDILEKANDGWEDVAMYYCQVDNNVKIGGNELWNVTILGDYP